MTFVSLETVAALERATAAMRRANDQMSEAVQQFAQALDWIELAMTPIAQLELLIGT